MSEMERIEATATGYLQASHLLLLEEMILAAMAPQEPECRTHVIAQMSRVGALRRVKDTFASGLLTPSGKRE